MKTLATIILTFVVTTCVAQKVDYIQVLKIDTTGGYFS